MANTGNIATIVGNVLTDSAIDLSTKADLVGGLVPSSQLPSYVDDVLEYTNLAGFPVTGESGKIYIDLATSKIYRWSGTVYVEVSAQVGTVWGGITGTLSNQTDLQTALNAKQSSLSGTGFVKSTAGVISYDTNTYLTGNQSISVTGDATGSGTTSIALTLANSGVTAGTYTKVTVDAKGRVTVGAALAVSDLPTLSLENIPDAWVKRSVKAATTANITLSAPQTVDGVALVAGDRVLVKDQTTASTNGIYIVAAGAWTRSTDADSITDLAGGVVNVDAGTVNGGFRFDTDLKTTDTLGTTAISFSKILDLNDTATANTASKVVVRDGSGNFSAGTITAALTGNASTATTVTGTNIGSTSGPISTTTTQAGWAERSGFNKMVIAAGSSGLPTTGTASPYYGYTVLSRRDNSSGYSGILVGYNNDEMWFTYNQVGTNYATWKRVWHESNLTNLNQLTNGPGYLTTATVLNTVLTPYAVGANTAVTTSDTIETAIEKLQGQVNARLSAESDTLATVTGRGANTATALSLTARTLTLSNFYPEYRYYFNAGALDLNWKKIADITLSTGLYIAASMQVIITDASSNHGASTQASPMRFIVSAIRSGGTQDAPDSGYVSGPSTDYVRLVKTALGVYEVQVRQVATYRHYMVEARVISYNAATITYATTPADGSTTGTIYTSVASHTDYAANLSVLGTATANSFVKTGGLATQFLKANGTVDSNTYLTASTVLSTVLTPYVVGANTAVTAADTIETAIEKLQGQVSARLSLSGGTLTGALSGTSALFTGNVGLGVSTSQSQLHLNGTITFSEAGFDALRLHTITHSHSDGSDVNNWLSLNVSNGAGTTNTVLRINGAGQLKLNNYLTATSFTGTVVGYLAFDAAGNIITAAGGGGGGTTLNGTGFVKASGTTISYDNSVYTAFNSSRFTGDLNTLGLSGTTGIYNIGAGYTNGAAATLYGTMLAFWNGDISTQLHVSYGGSVYWRQSVGTTYTGSTWKTFLDSANYTTYTVTKTGTGASGSWGISITGNAATATNISNTGTVTLASATESNSIYVTAPSYATDTPVKLLNFDWYSNVFSMGNIRSGATPSNGFGFYYTASGGSRIELARFSTSGNLTIGGTLTEQSSIRYKENILTLEDSLTKVNKLRGVEYNRKGASAKEIGVIAEEVHAILPEVINYNNQNEIDSVSYGRLTAVLIEAVKEQQQQINELKALLGK